MVKIEAKLVLYDHDSRSDSSCSKEDSHLRIRTKDIKLNLETHETLKRNLWTKKEPTGIRLR